MDALLVFECTAFECKQRPGSDLQGEGRVAAGGKNQQSDFVPAALLCILATLRSCVDSID